LETGLEMEVLLRKGCRVMQGYLFGKPMPGDAVTQWVQTQLLPRKAEWMQAAQPDGLQSQPYNSLG